GFAINAVIILLIGTIGFGPLVLVVAMGVAGFLSGMIMPSRDMLVRAAAPAGATGPALGVVSIRLRTAGVLGALLFGWIMDRGVPRVGCSAPASCSCCWSSCLRSLAICDYSGVFVR